MSSSLNRVMLMGNLTRDPEMKQTQNGTNVCNFGIAVNRKWKGSDGAQHEDVCFVDVKAWKRTAELCSEYLKKGRSVFVEGRLELDRWEKDGEKKSKLRVVAQQIHFLNSKQGGNAGGSEDPAGEETARSRAPAKGASARQSGGSRPGHAKADPDEIEPAGAAESEAEEENVPF